MFRKPKKNIRIRNVDSDNDEENGKFSEPMDVDLVKNGAEKKKKEHVKVQKPGPVLSFADDEEENGEVFQVKKSNYSKKLEKKLNRQRRRRHEGEDGEKNKVLEPTVINLENEGITLKKDEELQAQQERKEQLILNGRAAVMAGRNDASSSDDDEGSTRYKFSQPNRAEIMLESGKIPDAAAIHAARKRRQRARQCNQDFVPLESASAPLKLEKKGTSRLVREEDEASDEERITMGTGLEANDLTTRRANYFETIDQGVDPEPTVWPISEQMVNNSVFLAPPPPPPILGYNTKELASSDSITQRLRDRLTGLKEVFAAHRADVDRADKELAENEDEMKRLESEAPDLAARFRFYQDFRGYVTDLVECLDEKVPGLERLEEAVMKIWSDRGMYFAGRRRMDVRDQADETSQQMKGSTAPKWAREEEEARTRRAAEREGRRTRRRRGRELRSIAVAHIEGMSSDDEETELEAATFAKKLDEVHRLGEGLLEDVESEFGTVAGVANRMESWREFDDMAYSEAYANICFPKLLAPLIRYRLLTWNLLQADAEELDSMKWWQTLLLYGLTEDETMETLSKDPDLLLLPTLIEKVLLPKITSLVEKNWDPMFSSQTLRLVNFINKYVAEMPGMTATSPQVKNLLEAILAKLKYAVENDVFIPVSFIGGDSKGSTSPFFQRQFASAVKLLRNTLTFQGLLSQNHLHAIALDSLLNRYLLVALRSCQPCDAISKANMIVSTFPRWWFQTETKIPKLEMLGKQLKLLSSQVQPYETTEKDSHELVLSLIRTLQLSCPNPL